VARHLDHVRLVARDLLRLAGIGAREACSSQNAQSPGWYTNRSRWSFSVVVVDRPATWSIGMVADVLSLPVEWCVVRPR